MPEIEKYVALLKVCPAPCLKSGNCTGADNVLCRGDLKLFNKKAFTLNEIIARGTQSIYDAFPKTFWGNFADWAGRDISERAAEAFAKRFLK
ncbi:hypothetical protein AAIR98_001450 [Elusimicrobium simillimum]